VDFTNTRVRNKQKNKAKSSGRFLMNSLDPEAQAKLDRLRFGK
jgi:DNA-binding TFAR19-related protein (PDSD5 family)